MKSLHLYAPPSSRIAVFHLPQKTGNFSGKTKAGTGEARYCACVIRIMEYRFTAWRNQPLLTSSQNTGAELSHSRQEHRRLLTRETEKACTYFPASTALLMQFSLKCPGPQFPYVKLYSLYQDPSQNYFFRNSANSPS